MATMAHTDDSRPLLTPESIAVAGPPVAADSAISWTGLVSVDVKYSVIRGRDLREHETDDDRAEHAPTDVRDRTALRVADVDEGEHERADDR